MRPGSVESLIAPERDSHAHAEVCDVDQTMISVGDGEGAFSELKGLSFERDNRYPVCVTLQYYKATSSGEVDEIGSLGTDRNV